MDYKVRRLGGEFLDDSIELEEKYMLPPLTFPFTKEELRPLFENNLMWGGFYNDQLVGKIGYIRNNDNEYELDGMVIAPEHRGKHLAEKLISESLEEILKLKPKTIYLFVNPRNSGAVVRYLKQGFVINDWYPNKFGDGEDRLKMVFKMN